MKGLNIKESFRNKKFKYGGRSAAVSIIFVAALIAVNLVAGKLNWKLDLTQNKMFSLSDQSYKIIDSLKNNINIYILETPGQENKIVKSMLEQYSTKSGKIKIEYKDPVKYPEFAKQYNNGQEATPGSIVVVSGSKFKYIDANDLINISYDENGQPVADSLAVEQVVTGAITNVTSGSNYILLNLQGQEEEQLPDAISKQLGLENYTQKDIDLLTKDAALDPNEPLLVFSPKRDISTDEANQIKTFLSKGGRALFLMDITNENMPNFQSILNGYGVGLKKAIVIDGDPNYSTQNPAYLLPGFGDHEIVSPIIGKSLKVLIPGAQAIETLKNQRDTLLVSPLLTTSKNSWGKVNLQATNASKEPGDLAGPFNIAVAITDTPKDTNAKQTKLVVVSNGMFASSQAIGTGGNMDLLMNSINWLQDKKDSITIRPKSIADQTLTISAVQRLSLSGLVVIFIPLVITIYGVVTVMKRKRL